MFTTGNEWGRVGGSAKTEAKKIASRENGKKGGRPKHGAEYAVIYWHERTNNFHTQFFNKYETALKFYNSRTDDAFIHSFNGVIYQEIK